MRGEKLHTEHPLQRITPERMRRYVHSLSSLAASTQCALVRAVFVVSTKANPAGDVVWLKAILRSLDARERECRNAKKQNRIVASHKLAALGMSLMQEAQTSGIVAMKRAVAFRDGLAIALLAARPLRLRNFAGLRLGMHICPSAQGYRIDIPSHETKTGAPVETVVPAELVPYLVDYLQVHRPFLLSSARSDHLWINQYGLAYAYKHFGERISHMVETRLGVRVNPHLFRDCLATTIATADPEHVRMIASLLGHTNGRTGEAYYNQAKGLEAARASYANIRHLRHLHRPLRTKNQSHKGAS
jgi:integrase